MPYEYSIEDLSRLCKVSKQSVYALIKKNQPFVKDNSIRQGKKVKYNKAVLTLFLDYYGLNITEVSSTDELAPPLAPEPPSATAAVDFTAKDTIQALEREIEALKQELARVKEQNTELIRQNGQVLLLLQEEKNEKMKLLPAPKKSIRLFSIFHRNQNE